MKKEPRTGKELVWVKVGGKYITLVSSLTRSQLPNMVVMLTLGRCIQEKPSCVDTPGFQPTCNKCDTYCKTVSSFNIHYRTSHPPVKCKRCHKEFSTPNSLKHHMDEHRTKSHKCNNCGKLFAFESQLKDHLKSHHKLKPYPCPWVKNGICCPKDFNYKGDLNRQLRMHTDLELCCKFCDYKNVDKRNLMQHMRTHGSK